tara:strand:- start:200 stop:913 length:714 start_codon:yes stop_codon:yes gene_type:complete
MQTLIFDVDGTLTPSRGQIDPEFSSYLQQLATDMFYEFDVYLVTGSDKPKTVEQVGEDLYNKCVKVYQCSGNEIYIKDECIYKNDWIAPKELTDSLTKHLNESKFSCRTGNHIEQRIGMVNFSIVGRNCTLGERKLYVEYDKQNDERVKIATYLRNEFPTIEFKVAGETGLDIFPVGSNKSQIMKDWKPSAKVYFFGDMCQPGGNDYEIAETVSSMRNGKSFNVKGWQDTWNILKSI